MSLYDKIFDEVKKEVEANGIAQFEQYRNHEKLYGFLIGTSGSLDEIKVTDLFERINEIMKEKVPEQYHDTCFISLEPEFQYDGDYSHVNFRLGYEGPITDDAVIYRVAGIRYQHALDEKARLKKEKSSKNEIEELKRLMKKYPDIK